MFESFIEALPDKVRSTNNFEEFGTRFRKKNNALQYRYVELNQLYKKFIVLDLDEPKSERLNFYNLGSAFLWEEKGLPPPTYVVINPENAHCHYLYELRVPVYYTEHAHRAPQKFYENTDLALTNVLGADLAYVGKFTKNPLHPSWRTIRHGALYDLEDFAEYHLDLRSHKQKQKLADSLGGRNTTLFDTLRVWAYQEVKQHGSYAVFQQLVDNKALSINKLFLDNLNGILPAKEVLSTSTSVGKWTWKHRNSIGNGNKNRGVLELPDDMPIKEKQAQGAAYTNVIRTESVDDTIKLAIHACKQRGFTLTSGNLEKCGLARSTFSKHKEAVQNWMRILTT